MVRKNSVFLTYESSSWDKAPYLLLDDEKKRDSKEFLEELEAKISESEEPGSARILLGLLFPDYQASMKRGVGGYSVRTPTSPQTAQAEKRICDPDYFQIYFRAAVPEEMFSNAELEQIVLELNRGHSQSDIENVFSRVLSEVPKQHPKRTDYLWKLGRAVAKLSDDVIEKLAYAVADKADQYAYDVMNIGEAARALNIVFEAAQRLSATEAVQRILTGAMMRAADDTFARRIWEYTRDKSWKRKAGPAPKYF